MRRTSWLLGLGLSGLLSLSLVAIAGTAPGCGVSPAVTVLQLGPGEKPEGIKGDPVKLRRAGQEAYVGMKPGYFVVRSTEDWRTVWPDGHEPALPATFDASRSMLLLAAAQSNDTSELHIDKVIETGDKLHVLVRETRTGAGCRPKEEKVPFDAVIAARIDKPVKFYVEQASADSCGDAPNVEVKCRVNDGAAWAQKVDAQPGDTIDCQLSAESRGKAPVIDTSLSLGDLPGGSTAKLAYVKTSTRGTLLLDVFGTYSVRGEATDESGRKTLGAAIITAVPPKTRDVLVQLVWTNFDAGDDPETFPRVKLRASDGTAKGARVCSAESPRADFCEVKTRGASTRMVLKASSKRVPLEVLYVDERVDKGPLVCLQLYFDGKRTGEICDRTRRAPEEKWQVGSVAMETGELPSFAADAGAVADGGGGSDSGSKK